VSILKARTAPRTIVGLLAALGLVAAMTMPAFGASVTPEFVDVTSNLECDAFDGEGQTWLTLKVDPNPNGDGPFDYDDGTLFVTITNADDDKSFDWSSNIGVDAVYVKAGSDGSNLYRYDPPAEATSDTNLVSPGESGNGISHISFCYDQPDEAEESAPASEPVEESAPASEPVEESEEAEESQAEESIGEGVLGGNPTPTGAALPDTAAGTFGQIPATVLSLVLLGALAAMVTVRLARQR